MKIFFLSLLTIVLVATETISIKSKKNVLSRSLFNQVKSFAKELIESDDHIDVGHLLVEHIENCRYTCENDVEPTQNTNYNRTYNGCGNTIFQFIYFIRI